MNIIPRLLVVFGVILVVLGVAWYILGDALPIGKLPRDYMIQKANTTIFILIGTSIVVSLGITLVFLILRLLGGLE